MSFDPYAGLFAHIASLDDASPGSLGDQTLPGDEPLRFRNDHGLEFIRHSLEVESTDDGTHASTALFGLLGPIGPLPYFYSEMVAKAERDNEPAIRDFLGILSHRATSLLYRAWRKSRPYLEHQPGLAPDRQRKYSRAIEGLTGSGTLPQRIAWLDIAASRPIAAPDLFLRRPRNREGLRRLLRRQFAMPFEIEEFVGGWEPLPPEARPALGNSSLPPSLGRNTVVGSRIWQVQSTFRIVIGHPSPQQYALLKPGSESLRRIQLAVRMYCTGDLAFRLKIIVAGSTLSAGTLGGRDAPAMLGWNSFSGAPDPQRSYSLTISRDYNEHRI